MNWKDALIYLYFIIIESKQAEIYDDLQRSSNNDSPEFTDESDRQSRINDHLFI